MRSKTLLCLMSGVLGLIFSDVVFADVYMKTRVMNGMSESETWISGKKQRTTTQAPVIGETVVVTDLAAQKEYEIMPAKQVYQVKPIALPYDERTQEFLTGGGFGAMMGKKPSRASQDTVVDCDTQPKKLSEKKTFVNQPATGYSFTCEGSTTTLWFIEPSTPFDKLHKIEKEMKVFHKAHAEARFANYPEAERKKMIGAVERFGSGLAKSMGEIPHLKDAPKGILVAMEGSGMGGPQGGTGRLFEILELSDAKHPASTYEISKNYTQVDDIGQAMASEAMKGMGLGNLSGLMEPLGVNAQNQNPKSIPQPFSSPAQAVSKMEAASASVATDAVPPGMVRRPGPNGWIYEPVKTGAQLPATAGGVPQTNCPGERRPGPNGWVCL